MRVLNFISLVIALTLTTLVSVSKAETCTTNDLGDRTCVTNTPGTTTGNILTNSTFGTGSTTTTTGWSTDGHLHTHANFGNFPYQSGMDTSGGVWAGEGYTDDNIYQDVDLVGDGHLTKAQINEGFTSTQSADVWFWNNIENTFTLKQTITASDGTVTTQTRVINDHDPNRAFNGGTFTNYTNVYTESANSQNDYTIRAEMYNETAGTSYDSYHRGPDVDNVQLSITTAGVQSTTFTPCQELGTCTSAGTAINDAVNLTTDSGVDLFEDLDTKVEDAFKEVEKIEDVKVEEVKFDVIVEDDLGNIEEVEFKEFVEMQFTDFIAENNLEETFKEELKVEGISEEQFFDELGDSMMEELGGDMMNEIASLNDSEMMMEEPKMEEFKEEEAMTDELVKENKEELIEEKPTEEIKESKPEESNAINEEPTNETAKTEETLSTNEEATEPEGQESEAVSTEREMDEDTETEGQEETENNDETMENEENVDVKDRKVADNDVDSIGKKVEKIIKKINEKLKRVDQKLQATSLVISAGLNTNAPDLTAYKNKKLNGGNIPDGNLDLFQKFNILEQQQVYGDVTLVAYTGNDPIAIRQNALLEVETRINTLQAEISALKSLQ